METDELVPIFEAGSDVELLLYRTVLQEAGIDVNARQTGEPVVTGDIYRLRQPSYLLLVNAADEENARRYIEDYQRQIDAGELRLGDEDSPTMQTATVSKGRWLFWRVLLAVLIILAVILSASVIVQLMR